MITPADEALLRRASRLAMNGRGRVEPNPMVGCVLVKHGVVIGEGHHARYGGPHAEPNALADCVARGHDPRGATAYVTLEPCCHTNKKTPPCAPRLIEAGVARVVVGCPDPNPDVDGRGLAMLRAAGITVDAATPGLAAECAQLIAPFRTPPFYTTLKWAQSADGYVAGAGGMPVRITGRAADLAVHRLRTRCDAIVVGIDTVLMDDPRLTVRDVDVLRRPTRIVLDRRCRLPLDCALLADAASAPVVVITDSVSLEPRQSPAVNLDADVGAERRAEALSAGRGPHAFAVRAAGGRVIGVDTAGLGVRDLIAAVNVVPPSTHVLIEPGPRLAAAALPDADRLWVFESSARLDVGGTAPRAAAVPPSYVETGRLTLGPDTLMEYLNRDAASFVTATASADFVLEAEAANRRGG